MLTPAFPFKELLPHANKIAALLGIYAQHRNTDAPVCRRFRLRISLRGIGWWIGVLHAAEKLELTAALYQGLTSVMPQM